MDSPTTHLISRRDALIVGAATAATAAAQLMVELEGEVFFEALLLRGSGLFRDVFREINADREF